MLFTRTMICAGLLFGASSGLQAQETALESQQENRVQPEAKKLLERMAAFYKKMDMATVNATLKIEAEGLPQAMRQEAMTAIKRPNKFVSLSNSPMMGGFDASSDGEKMIIAMAMANAAGCIELSADCTCEEGVNLTFLRAGGSSSSSSSSSR